MAVKYDVCMNGVRGYMAMNDAEYVEAIAELISEGFTFNAEFWGVWERDTGAPLPGYEYLGNHIEAARIKKYY